MWWIIPMIMMPNWHSVPKLSMWKPQRATTLISILNSLCLFPDLIWVTRYVVVVIIVEICCLLNIPIFSLINLINHSFRSPTISLTLAYSQLQEGDVKGGGGGGCHYLNLSDTSDKLFFDCMYWLFFHILLKNLHDVLYN